VLLGTPSFVSMLRADGFQFTDVGERIRMTMGMPMQGVDQPELISDGLEEASRPEVYYQPPLINIVKFACNACEDNVYRLAEVSANIIDQCVAQGVREHRFRIGVGHRRSSST